MTIFNRTNHSRIRILYFTREKYPSFRVDITKLFLKYLKAKKVETTIVSTTDSPAFHNYRHQIHNTYLFKKSFKSKAINSFFSFFFDCFVLIKHSRKFHIIQVRDKILTALISLVYCKYKGYIFTYWMSLPYPEDDIARALNQKKSIGLLRSYLTLLRGLITYPILYTIVLPNSHCTFVQSAQMEKDIKERIYKHNKIIVVPMGIDYDHLLNLSSYKEISSLLEAFIPIVYLGALDANRNIDFFLKCIFYYRNNYSSNILLLLIGDSSESSDRQKIEKLIYKYHLQNNILITGWLKQEIALKIAKSCKIGLCAIPEGYTFNSMSPTKAIEYIGIGKPIVVNRHPDQNQLINNTKCGISVNYVPKEFAEAIYKIISNYDYYLDNIKKGQSYIKRYRSYDHIAEYLKETYSTMSSLS